MIRDSHELKFSQENLIIKKYFDSKDGYLDI